MVKSREMYVTHILFLYHSYTCIPTRGIHLTLFFPLLLSTKKLKALYGRKDDHVQMEKRAYFTRPIMERDVIDMTIINVRPATLKKVLSLESLADGYRGTG